ncbi:LacI family DNA-binding transcriptional regulator [Micrococcales bacterium 31B]|nr:LacI family DNA-binding transcriptional regulator [Micrococcales bacterium 31B]
MSSFLQGGQRRATIGDVARAAGVSRATVSRVMNGRDTVDPKLADLVRAAAENLGYEPSKAAQALSLGKTLSIGIIVPDLANPTFHAALQGVTRAAAADGYRVVVADTAEHPEDERETALNLRKYCDGLVLCAPRMSDAELESCLPDLYPSVLTNRRSPEAAVPVLAIDYAAGMHDLLDHLVALGHRRIAFASGPERSYSNQERLRGLAEYRRDGVEVQVVPCGAFFDDGMAATEPLLATEATAVVAYNDLVALGVNAGLAERGVSVPAQVSLAGFDDIPFARYATPSLTSAFVPQESIGQLAWARLFALIEGREPAHNLLFRPSIAVRDSTAPPAP